ncbi:MAG: site-specific integrase [Planctomycetota bacterium]|nr:site-specific integrase [Planctomycetota bacterium]
MTPWQNRVTKLTRRMADDMKLRNYSQNTIDAYTYHVGRFAEFLGRPLEQASPEDVRSFQLHLIEERKVGWSSFNQAVCGLRFLFRTTYPRDWAVSMVPFGKRPKKLPAVLSSEEVTSLLSCVPNLKHRTFLLTLYAAGLRLNEAAALTIADIDSQRMQLRVACGKGAKERSVPLSPRLLTALREYWKQYQPPQYLFPGKTFDVPLSGTTIQKMCKVAVQKAGIRKHVTPHTLRHSYATGLLEAGVDLLAISRLLGHRSFSTTMIYLHVRRTHLGSVPSPIDWLPVQQLPGWAAAPAAADASCRSEEESTPTGNNDASPPSE